MNTMASKITRRAAAFSAACLLLGSIAPIAQAQPASPVQVWDIVVSGTQRGLAQITFSSDFTLSGVEIITGTIHDSSTDTNPRGPFFSGSRLPFPENTNSTPVTNFYGRAYLSGRWTYDSAGRTIGVMSESGGPDSLTNGISFKAVVRPDVRINIEGLRVDLFRRHHDCVVRQ